MDTDTPRRALGRGNPKGLGADCIELYPCPGRVWLPADFIEQHAALLVPHEQALIRCHTNALKEVAVPEDLTGCLARSPDVAIAGMRPIIARRSGGRSAYWPERKLKFKGCRPVMDGAIYPLEVLDAGSRSIKYTNIPFGTISAEGIMRELLGWAFCREHDLPIHLVPICIYEYSTDGRTFGYCLVSETRGEDRIEAHIEYPACTVEELIRAKCEAQPVINGTPIGSELRLHDVNLWWYVEEKSRLLCAMHFHGGFRGILNSNIGNDVLLPSHSRRSQTAATGSGGGFELCLCDFDTFRVRVVPEHADRAFIEEFALWAMIEVIKGSLSICDYVEIPGGASADEIAEELGRVYFEKSSLWRAYLRRFERAAKARGWDAEMVRLAFANARRTNALANVLASSVVNSHYLRQMSGSRAVFYPHN